jgi:hypothetical protein
MASDSDLAAQPCPIGWPKMRPVWSAQCTLCDGVSGVWFEGDAKKPIKHKPDCPNATEQH